MANEDLIIFLQNQISKVEAEIVSYNNRKGTFDTSIAAMEANIVYFNEQKASIDLLIDQSNQDISKYEATINILSIL